MAGRMPQPRAGRPSPKAISFLARYIRVFFYSLFCSSINRYQSTMLIELLCPVRGLARLAWGNVRSTSTSGAILMETSENPGKQSSVPILSQRIADLYQTFKM